MAGHSHWAGIKHKKGRQDKERSRLFSKLAREITVAAKLGTPDPEKNPRLRSAIQFAKESNMPKDNIQRAINKSSSLNNENFVNLRYEGFGPFNVAFIIETLTDNKNRSASKIRTILQKNGGRLGENGSASHLFKNCGIIKIDQQLISDENILEYAINAGADDCSTFSGMHNIICKKEDFYNVKTEIEKKIKSFYSGIEWLPINYKKLNEEQVKKVEQVLDELENDDDVQKIFTNYKIES